MNQASAGTCATCLTTSGACVLHALFLELRDLDATPVDGPDDPPASPPLSPKKLMLETAMDQVCGVLALLAAELEIEREGGAR